MNCTPKTVDSYTNILKPFSTFCKLQGVKKLAEVDNFFVDSYLTEMSSRGHNDGVDIGGFSRTGAAKQHDDTSGFDVHMDVF